MGKNLKKSGYMYVRNWFTSLYSWNEHNIVDQLYSNKNFKENKEKPDSIEPRRGILISLSSLVLPSGES